MTTTEAAAALGITPRSVAKAIRSGHLAATRFGRAYDISPEAIAAYRAYLAREGCGGRPRKTKGRDDLIGTCGELAQQCRDLEERHHVED
jgi:excisionase family DNA binding protein